MNCSCCCCLGFFFCFFCFPEEREECMGNHKIAEDKKCSGAREKNKSNTPEPEREDSGTLLSTDDNIFAELSDHTVARGEGQSCWVYLQSSRSFYTSDWFEKVTCTLNNAAEWDDPTYSGWVSLRSERRLVVHLYKCRPSLAKLAGLCLTRENAASIITTQVESL